MAFNFNWSPLLADTSRAKEMITSALNKSPKPPIIVDDIIVTELNLGSVPPQLDILEIGELATDKFRGIFKMQYAGDAFLTLKTRVQANPLNTYLSNQSDFASPQPLAASSGLKIPISITLSEIKLSGFVILVFSKQKGITVVFRNDPLESIKVSSTFDSISFIRNYLQRRLEAQLRQLFMDDLPMIIHKLSLRIWPGPENFAEINSNINKHTATEETEEKPIDPLATPSQHAAPGEGDVDFDSLSLETRNTDQSHPAFSQKNLLRLAALTDSHRTLSLFTPPIKDAVFRAWAGAAERGDGHFASNIAPPSLRALATAGIAPLQRRSTGSVSSTTSYSVTESHAASISSAPTNSPSRPALSALQSMHGATSYAPGMTGRSRPHHGRKRKNRIVNLRKKNEPQPEVQQNEEASKTGQRVPSSSQPEPADDALNERPLTPTSIDPPSSSAGDSYGARRIYEGEIETAPNSPEKRPAEHRTPRPVLSRQPATESMLERVPTLDPPLPSNTNYATSSNIPHFISIDDAIATSHPAFTYRSKDHRLQTERYSASRASDDLQNHQNHHHQQSNPQEEDMASAGAPGGILEQAWMAKMADEIARKVANERRDLQDEDGEGDNQRTIRGRKTSFWNAQGSAGDVSPPPAYTSS